MERALSWRLGLSALMIPALIGVFVADHHAGESAPILFVLCVALGLRSVWEMCQLLQARSMRPHLTSCSAGVLLLLVAAWGARTIPAMSGHSSLEWIALAVTVCVLGLMAVEVWRFRDPGHSVESLGANLLAVLYAGLLLAVTAQLRWVAGTEAGYQVLASLVIPVKFGDIGAYTSGRLFGRRKMAPRLSPGKTWAGFVGALVGASVGSLLWLQIAPGLFDESWKAPAVWACAVYGVVLGLVGLFGDLCESLIKRDVGQKDAARLMPGFGGLLDLLDSILYAGPVALMLWDVLPLRTW